MDLQARYNDVKAIVKDVVNSMNYGDHVLAPLRLPKEQSHTPQQLMYLRISSGFEVEGVIEKFNERVGGTNYHGFYLDSRHVCGGIWNLHLVYDPKL